MRTGEAYLQLAQLAIADASEQMIQAAVGNAVLAAIAAGDALCGFALGEYSRGQDHGQAVELLERANLADRGLPTKLARLMELKDNAHYATKAISQDRAQSAVDSAAALIAAARAM